ncbi:MAG TPA: penicillin acylase family protein [Thermoanaerobaculia bacterium]|jgi:penicillin amidase|nr:penicillin acylase family protein [Thermoanaerobaculia bacterium]
MILKPRRSRLRRAFRALAFVLVLLVLAVLVGRVWFHHRMVASLPPLDGELRLTGLAAPVSIERDELGVPTIRAGNRLDAVRALGFLHAQDRFFQMDLLRRQAAGELADLVGYGAVRLDQAHRVHRFRAVARQVIARAKPEDRAVLEAYAAGVNAGLAALGDKPFEYVALIADPEPWKPEDSILAVHAMFLELNDGTGSRESELGELQKMVPPAMFDFLAPRGTEWDAPLVGSAIDPPPVPGPEVMDLRKQAATPARAALPRFPDEEASAAGSNNFAVSGAHTADGHALLANDMHLGIRVPNTWYRVSIVRPDERGGTLRLTGASLPGTPIVSVGSNGHVAWGFTNSYGDWTDVVQLELDSKNPHLYRTPQGLKKIEEVKEELEIKSFPDDSETVEETIWGPVIGHDRRKRPLVLAWTAHHPEAVNLEMGSLETARTIDEAMAVANRSGIPPQNFTVADETGRVGWTIIGQIPRRVGFDGRLPTSWADGSRRWDGWLTPEEHPRIVDPPSGRIWTANARVVDGDLLAKIGDGSYALGARARQIRDGLMALEKATPKDLLAIQLDDRALFLARWRDLLLQELTPEAVNGHPQRATLRRLVMTTWTGRASIDSVAYRAARMFRGLVRDRVFNLLTHQEDTPEAFRVRPNPQLEGSLWRLVTERPVHLLDPRFPSWDAELLASVDDTIALMETDGPKLANRTWGERNTTRIQHPLSLIVPFLGRWLDMPAHPLPGDEDMPRVQGRAHGASERLVVSPGHEETGIFHMPVGQSGHPLSPYYRKGHAAWEEGRPTPFLPGRTLHRLVLTP